MPKLPSGHAATRRRDPRYRITKPVCSACRLAFDTFTQLRRHECGDTEPEEQE